MPSNAISANKPALLVALAALCGALPAHAQVFAGTSDSGAVTLSNFQSEATPLLLLDAPPAPAAPPAAPVPKEAAAPAVPRRSTAPAVPPGLRPLILAAAREHGLEPALVAAVAAAESGFDARARSPKGAVGLMQLLPATARRFDVRDRLEPAQSLRGGAAYLRWLHGRFGGDLVRVLAAYNAGEGAVEAAGGVPPFGETRAYVPRVLDWLDAYATGFAR